jgi:hypothetical protein
LARSRLIRSRSVLQGRLYRYRFDMSVPKRSRLSRKFDWEDMVYTSHFDISVPKRSMLCRREERHRERMSRSNISDPKDSMSCRRECLQKKGHRERKSHLNIFVRKGSMSCRSKFALGRIDKSRLHKSVRVDSRFGSDSRIGLLLNRTVTGHCSFCIQAQDDYIAGAN